MRPNHDEEPDLRSESGAALLSRLHNINDVPNTEDYVPHLLNVLEQAPEWPLRFRAAELIRDRATVMEIPQGELDRFLNRIEALAGESRGRWLTANERWLLLALDSERDRLVNDVPEFLPPWFYATAAEVAWAQRDIHMASPDD